MFKKLFKKRQEDYMDLPINEENKWDFIWGIKSFDDLNGEEEATLYTMNDFDICYNKENNKYIMSVETIYSFEGGIEAQQKYLLYILSCFTDWMKQHNYDTELFISMDYIFTMDKRLNCDFDTIEELYACFKLLVNGFCSQGVQKK